MAMPSGSRQRTQAIKLKVAETTAQAPAPQNPPIKVRYFGEVIRVLQSHGINHGSQSDAKLAELAKLDAEFKADEHCKASGLRMVGYYQANELCDDLELGPLGAKIAEKIRWMVNGRQSMAEIRLDPPEMGSMQIRLNVSGDSASVSFVVQSQQAKEALNEAMPRLRDMFSEQGLDLGESFVSQQNSGEAGDGEFADQQGGGFGESADEETKSQETHVVRPANGLIDDYV